MSQSHWQWENAAAGAVAGFATVAAMHPLDVVRTRFQGIQTHSPICVFVLFKVSLSFFCLFDLVS